MYGDNAQSSASTVCYLRWITASHFCWKMNLYIRRSQYLYKFWGGRSSAFVEKICGKAAHFNHFSPIAFHLRRGLIKRKSRNSAEESCASTNLTSKYYITQLSIVNWTYRAARWSCFLVRAFNQKSFYAFLFTKIVETAAIVDTPSWCSILSSAKTCGRYFNWFQHLRLSIWPPLNVGMHPL